MYSRPADHLRSKIKIPDNYGGNAFGGINDMSSRYCDIKDDDKRDTPFKEDLIPFSPTPSSAVIEDGADAFSEEDSKDNEISVSSQSTPKSSPLSSLLPNFIGSSAHFPFGHGIGGEEMLILAMMAMIFMSEGETDNELLLLLGLLLFAG